MGASTFSKHDLEMIEISWSFVKDKQLLGLNTMIRIFESSKDIKKMFKFANSLESTTNMLQNTKIRNHGNQVIKTLDKIIHLLVKSSINEKEKENLFSLGQKHYHFGLKHEHFKVIFKIYVCLL
jgi:hypothetical protein